MVPALAVDCGFNSILHACMFWRENMLNMPDKPVCLGLLSPKQHA